MILNLSLNCPSQLFNNMMLIKVKDTILGNELVTGIINVWKTVDEQNYKKCIGHLRKVPPKIIKLKVLDFFFTLFFSYTYVVNVWFVLYSLLN